MVSFTSFDFAPPKTPWIILGTHFTRTDYFLEVGANCFSPGRVDINQCRGGRSDWRQKAGKAGIPTVHSVLAEVDRPFL